MSPMGYEPTISVLEWTKTVHTATVIGDRKLSWMIIHIKQFVTGLKWEKGKKNCRIFQITLLSLLYIIYSWTNYRKYKILTLVKSYHLWYEYLHSKYFESVCTSGGTYQSNKRDKVSNNTRQRRFSVSVVSKESFCSMKEMLCLFVCLAFK
jgi:hypothetical protein